jgi:hypothetical protein
MVHANIIDEGDKEGKIVIQFLLKLRAWGEEVEKEQRTEAF